jgi:hypothetical protein
VRTKNLEEAELHRAETILQIIEGNAVAKECFCKVSENVKLEYQTIISHLHDKLVQKQNFEFYEQMIEEIWSSKDVS